MDSCYGIDNVFVLVVVRPTVSGAVLVVPMCTCWLERHANSDQRRLQPANRVGADSQPARRVYNGLEGQQCSGDENKSRRRHMDNDRVSVLMSGRSFVCC